MRAQLRHSRGFTMVELVVAMVLASIIVGFTSLMIATPVQAYIAQSRRAELSDSAEAAMRTIGADVRGALPNSVRWQTVSGVRVLELVRVINVVSYRENWPERVPMQFGTPIGAFSSLQNLDCATFANPLPQPLQVVVDNRRAPNTRTAYGLTNVVTPATTTIGCNTTAAGTDITLSPGFRFTHYPLDRSLNGRAYIVSGVTQYQCDLSAGVLRRYESLPIRSSIVRATGTGSVIARDITACTFQAIAGNQDHGGIAIIEITTSRAVGGNGTDRLRMVRQIRVENPS
jgi:MSHA biogenesis protein MshO